MEQPHPADKKLRRSEKQTEPGFFRVDLQRVEKWSGWTTLCFFKNLRLRPVAWKTGQNIILMGWPMGDSLDKTIGWLYATYFIMVHNGMCFFVDFMEAMADYSTWWSSIVLLPEGTTPHLIINQYKSYGSSTKHPEGMKKGHVKKKKWFFWWWESPYISQRIHGNI